MINTSIKSLTLGLKHLTSLSILNLTVSHIEDLLLTSLTFGLTKLKSLIKLGLSHVKVYNSGWLKSLALSLSHLKYLTTLDLYFYCYDIISDEEVESLILGLKGLRSLFLLQLLWP